MFLFLTATAISLFIPSHVRISKAINLHAAGAPVLALVADTTQWPQWHPAFIPNDSVRFPAITITKTAQSDSEVVMQLRQNGKTPVTNGWRLYSHAGSDSLTLQWYMDFHLKWYPWQKFGALFYENTYGTMMEQGLANIKRKLEE